VAKVVYLSRKFEGSQNGLSYIRSIPMTDEPPVKY